MRKEYWLLGVAGAILIALPLGWISLALLLYLPGFALTTLLKKKFTLVEAAAIPVTVSLIAIPFAAFSSSTMMPHGAAPLLAITVAAISIYHYHRSAEITVDTSDRLALAAGIALFLIVLGAAIRTFHVSDDGLMYVFTHGLDLNFHLSIAQRYLVAPAFPPEDPYLPGYPIAYNWFMHVLFGETSAATGLHIFDGFKALVAVASSLLLMDAYLLARKAFGSGYKPALLAGLVYVATSGLSWVFIVLNWLQGTEFNLFKYLVMEIPGVMVLKYDPTSLYFFLPQTQTFGLIMLIFSLYLALIAVEKKSIALAAGTGLTLAALIFYHLITAFPAFVALGLFFAYMLYKDRTTRMAVVVILPLFIGGIAGLLQYGMFSSSAGSQVKLGQHPDVLLTTLASLGLLIPFAAYEAYRSWKNDGVKLLSILALVCLAMLCTLVMEDTNNTYRFLVYASVPVCLLAGMAFYRFFTSKGRIKKAAAATAILLLLPTTLMVTAYYYTNSVDNLASAADANAIKWITGNTPADAVIFEEPSHFPRVPILSGRDVSYSGEIYTRQYHGVVLQGEMENIMSSDEPMDVHDRLMMYDVDYVLIGNKEWHDPFASTMTDTAYFQMVYDADGVQVYKVL